MLFFFGRKAEKTAGTCENTDMETKLYLPDREEAERILLEGLKRNPGKWGMHSRNCANSAEAIGTAAGLDGTRCFVSGLLHDIGRRFGNVQLAHIYYGWKYMQELGYPAIARICLSHSFAMKTVDAYGGAFDLKDNEIQEMRDALKTMEYDDYDRLIQLCDNISGASGIMRMEDRIADIISRYSHFPEEKRQATFGLVDYFEQKTGKDIYQLACGGHTVDHY